jgi:hypothetical protein
MDAVQQHVAVLELERFAQDHGFRCMDLMGLIAKATERDDRGDVSMPPWSFGQQVRHVPHDVAAAIGVCEAEVVDLCRRQWMQGRS